MVQRLSDHTIIIHNRYSVSQFHRGGPFASVLSPPHCCISELGDTDSEKLGNISSTLIDSDFHLISHF